MARADIPTVDETYELLSHSRGRLVLQYFDQHSNPVKLEDITSTIANWEAAEGVSPSEEDLRAVRESLHEEFLPWFGELGLATYDPDGEMVRYDAEAISTALANVETVLEFVWSGDGSVTTDLGEPGDGQSVGGE